MPAFAFRPEPFSPHPFMRSAHLQTVLGTRFRVNGGVSYRRLRLDTSDGDFIDLDFADAPGHAWADQDDKAPVMLLLHGLEGSAQAGYAAELYHMAAVHGIRPVGMNFRSCSGEMNRTSRLYHMGATDDVALVMDTLQRLFPASPFVLVGISLGGNMLLKYLGENGEDASTRIAAAVAISPPFIAVGQQPLNDNRLGRLYGLYLLRKLRRKVRAKATLLAASPADYHAAVNARILRDFDQAATAPLHGFDSAQDYYARSQSLNFLPGIRVPTLLIRAYDDPFFNRDVPLDVITGNDYLIPAFTEYGGHVGFIEGLPPFRFSNWACRQTIRFFQAALAVPG